MRGVIYFIVLSGLLACVCGASPAQASDLAGVRTLAREKAAAVSILRTKASNQIATLAQDRIFIAYLNAPTQGQGARLRTRMAAMLTTLWGRFGLREFMLVDRSGVLVVRMGNTGAAPIEYDVKRDPVLAAGFAQAPQTAAMIAGADALTYAAPVVWRRQAEFVLSGRQDLAAYRKVLSSGLPAGAFIALTDSKGRILADTRDAAPSGGLVAGLSLDALRRTVPGSNGDGAGEIARAGENYYVSYQKAGDWTIVAGAPVPPPRRCPNAGERLCG
jgi:hypothetical protein